MTTVFVSAVTVGALFLGGVGPAFATGQIYGNYGQGPAPQSYGAPAYGAPVYGQPHHAGPPVYAYRDDRDCAGESVAGTLIGGVLGGVIGSNLGRGHGHHGWYGHRHSNRGPATVAGVLLGSFAGNAIASSACNNRGGYAPSPYGYAPQYAGPQYDDEYGPGYDEDEHYDPDAPYDGR
ncbi:MAG: glycine zipper 2TM domain-containing protein [Alphaproteobacteria bacterium]|nr:glycine zipper 2TM domain-containing protein [Alphaproteobacteria bacterium]